MSQLIPNLEVFTCLSCRVAFKSPELQRLHYKTDWHRYNLKRKVAELPSVTAEEFERRVINKKNAAEISTQNQSVYCKICGKSFGNANAYTNHLNSKKHKENEKNFEPVESATAASTGTESVKGSDDGLSEGSVAVQIDSDEWNEENDDFTENPIDNDDCLFCKEHNGNFYKNLEHMTIRHSFFIPDIEYCSDVEALLRYLGEKVSQGFMCLWCNEKGKTFHSAEAARAHMIDKGHCKMIYEGIALAEYSEFYDYSSSYPDAAENVDAEEEVAAAPEIDGSEFQLQLPSGAIVGHRSLMRYYKQSVNPSKALMVVKKSDKKLHKVLATYRALGWNENDQIAAAKRAKDIHCMKRLQSKYMMKLGVQQNKMQHHFRQQVTF